MMNDIQLLKSVSQYIDMKGNIYELDNNGNIDDMSIPSIGNIVSAPQSWWEHLSNTDIKIADIVFGGLIEKDMYGKS
jgi:hypothetical protein